MCAKTRARERERESESESESESKGGRDEPTRIATALKDLLDRSPAAREPPNHLRLAMGRRKEAFGITRCSDEMDIHALSFNYWFQKSSVKRDRG